MGNGGAAGETREVVLSLHSVHNVQHSPSESYYGMATNHVAEEIPVTSERPARLMARLDSVLSVRIFLHNRGSPTTNDRPIGQLSIPVRELIDTCGPGIYQTWFLLEPATPYDTRSHDRLVERFRNALHVVTEDLHASRICLSLLEASAQPGEWARTENEKERVTYYGPMLQSHVQHLQFVRGYFDHQERGEYRFPEVKKSRSGAKGVVEAGDLRSELERLQQRQLEEEVAHLQGELDQVTNEANRRIERGNESIVKLKAELKQLRDEEGPRLEAERRDAELRLEAARQRANELRARGGAAGEASAGAGAGAGGAGAGDTEVEKLRQDKLVLSNQKAALMKMVQDVYGGSQGAGPLGSVGAAAGPGSAESERKLLPDPRDLLGTPKMKPL